MKLYAGLAFMKKWLKNSTVGALLIVSQQLSGQNIPIGSWRTHFSYMGARNLTELNGTIYCATEFGLFSYSPSDNSLRTLSKTNGLSDVGVTAILGDPISGQVIIGYQSGLVDVVGESGIKVTRNLKESTLQFNKQINSIVSDGTLAYAATGLGIVTISLSTGAIVDNFRSIGAGGIDVVGLDLALSGTQLYALTDIGILMGSTESNLLDFNNWDLIAADTSDFKDLVAIDDGLTCVESDNRIISFQSGVWILKYSSVEPILKLRSINGTVYFAKASGIYRMESGDAELVQATSHTNATDFLLNDNLWIADSQSGLYNADGESFIPNGPQSDAFTNLKYLGGSIYGFYHGNPEVTSSGELRGYEVFDGFSWQNKTIDGFNNISDVAYFGNDFYFSSITLGVYTESSGIFNESNSTLSIGNAGSTTIPRLLTGELGLYALAYNHSSTIHIMNEEGEWSNFTPTLVGSQYATDFKISKSGVLWISKGGSENNALSAFDPEENDQISISTAQGLPSRVINSFQVDLNDEVWVGTASGLVSFPFGSFPFDGVEFITPFFENEPLFEDIEIQSVQTDGGGRLWVGANGRLSVFSPTFTNLDYLFTPENSPLPSGNILSMTYNSSNGEMYILTDKGLVSFRSNSSNAINSHRNVEIFPNPVRPGFIGEVGIKGVYTNAAIKVTDINGKLINELRANGGTASWNLRDYLGMPVDSGVYIILSNSPDGDDSYVGKVAVIR